MELEYIRVLKTRALGIEGSSPSRATNTTKGELRMNHLQLVTNALTTINQVYGDTSVDRLTTKESLTEIRDEIDIMLETLSDLD